MNTQTPTLEPATRLNKDIRAAIGILSVDEARFLVDTYYQIQKFRQASANQVRSLDKSEEPHAVIDWLQTNMRGLENSIKSALDIYGDQHVPSQWAKSICGIGPVISAGLLAHIDIEKAPTVGHIWSFAGLNPESKWEKGQKRPWNASLKTLCWKIGESFVKQSGNSKDFYGKLLIERKDYEWKRNLAGELSGQAREKLANFKIGKSTDAHKWYSGRVTREAAEAYLAGKDLKLVEEGQGVPMLPPGHIHARAKRWSCKLFLSHFHHVAYETFHGEKPPKPYILTQEGGHAHEVTVPNWPMA